MAALPLSNYNALSCAPVLNGPDFMSSHVISFLSIMLSDLSSDKLNPEKLYALYFSTIHRSIEKRSVIDRRESSVQYALQIINF